MQRLHSWRRCWRVQPGTNEPLPTGQPGRSPDLPRSFRRTRRGRSAIELTGSSRDPSTYRFGGRRTGFADDWRDRRFWGKRHKPFWRCVTLASTDGPSFRRWTPCGGVDAMAASAASAQRQDVTVGCTMLCALRRLERAQRTARNGALWRPASFGKPVGCAVPFGGMRKLLRRARLLVRRVRIAAWNVRSKALWGRRSMCTRGPFGGSRAHCRVSSFGGAHGGRTCAAVRSTALEHRAAPGLWAWRCVRRLGRL